MEILRKKLYECIEKYGPLDFRTIKVSQLLDQHIVQAMKEGKEINA